MKGKSLETECEVTGGIWKAPSVSQQPGLRLMRWSVRQTEDGTRHLVGYNATYHEGRVSTAIVSFDPSTARATTRSGRVYELVGAPGYDADAEYVWKSATSPDLKWAEVTEEYKRALQEHQSRKEFP